MRTPCTSPTVVALTGLVALALPMGIGRFAFTPILPMMQADAGLSVVAGGWLASANYLGTLLGALLAMVVRVPAPFAIRAGLVTIAVATIAMGFDDRVAVWIVLRVLAGMATGWVLPIASGWSLERLSPLRRPVLNATVFAGYGAGIAGAGIACLALMKLHASSAQAWVCLGGLALGATAVIWPLFRADGDEGVGPDERAWAVWGTARLTPPRPCRAPVRSRREGRRHPRSRRSVG